MLAGIGFMEKELIRILCLNLVQDTGDGFQDIVLSKLCQTFRIRKVFPRRFLFKKLSKDRKINTENMKVIQERKDDNKITKNYSV